MKALKMQLNQILCKCLYQRYLYIFIQRIITKPQ